MLRHLILIFTIFAFLNIQAQTPQALNYQAVARNTTGAILANQSVGIRISITDGSAGATLYQETHTVTTNQFGLFTLGVGNGTVVSGIFSSIPWATITPWLQVEMDPAGGSAYVMMGSSALLSVPYALHSNTSDDNKWTVTGNDIYNNNSGNVGIGTSSPQYQLHMKSNGDAVNAISSGATGAAWSYYMQNDTLRSAVGWSNLNNALTFHVKGDDRMVVNGLGNVGIGITTPDAQLHLHKDTDPMLLLTNSTSGSTANDGSAIWLNGNDLKVDNLENGNIVFNTNYQERMRITNTGNLRITDGTQGDGKVLTSDASGNASWKVPAAGQVYFEAYKTSGQQTIPAGGVHRVIFDTTMVNIGNAYDEDSSLFTAPTSGVYFFYGELFWNGQSTNQIEFGMRKAGVTGWNGAQGFGKTGVNYENTNLSGSLFLNAGDKVEFFAIFYQQGGGTSINIGGSWEFCYIKGYRVN